MAELYESPKQYLSLGGQSGTASDGKPSIENIIESLPPEEREEALRYITAPPSGEEIARAMAQKNAKGELMEMTLEQYRLYKAHQKTKETDVLSTLGEAASVVLDDIFKAAGSVYDKPVDSLTKLTPSVVEAFAQGTRGLYGMAAQSADPTSALFRVKNALLANGDDEEAEYNQFMEAQAFTLHSMRLMKGQDTIVMDKDAINPEVTQVMSYIADPTLFIPFGGIAAKGATMVGMGEKLAMASARTAGIKRMVMGGALKWGVGAPIEFMGTAVRNTIDYGLERSAKAFETVTGMPAAEVRATAQMSGLQTASAALTGATVPLPLVGDVAGAMVGSTTARGVGEAISAFGEQMIKQKDTGRGVLGYAGQALRDTKKQGIVLSKHAEGLLRIVEAADPLFVYADEITSGAFQGAAIGGGLGYLAGGEEGMAGGIGSGLVLGAVGAGAGRLAADVTGQTKFEQIAVQRKLVIEGLKQVGNENAVAFEAMALAAEATGDRKFQAQIDGIIAGMDVINPDVVIKTFNEKQYGSYLTQNGIDPSTGKLREKSRIFPELGDRRTIADVLGILRDNGNNFAGNPAGFEKAITTEARYKKLKPVWNRLDDNAKAVLLKQIQNNSNPEFVKSLKGRGVNEYFGDLAYSERLAEMINTLNQKNANLVAGKIAETLKAETRSDKKLTRRGQMLKEKLQADGYIDKDGTIRKFRNPDVEETMDSFGVSAGWTKRRLSTGQTEIVINLDNFMAKGNREVMPHELYHSVMRDSVFAKDYSDRLIQKLVGTFDPQTGKMLEKGVIDPDQLQKFMEGYINSVHRNQSDEFRQRKIKELNTAVDEYKKSIDPNRVAGSTPTLLENLVEEFGAYYFAKFIMDKPVDFLFRGGEYSGLRAVFETAKQGFVDFWKNKIAKNNPSVNFDNIEGFALSKGFGKDGSRAKVTALDLFMQDIVRMQSNINKGGRFDIANLSPDARKNFIQTHGLRGQGFETIDKQGNLKKPKLRRYTAEEIRQGKEMFKILDSLSDAEHRGGMRRDGDGNWSGKPNTAQMNALIGSGYLQRAWFDRLTAAYNIVEGKGSNVVEFGYLGYSAHIGDGNERVYGAAVPFKNRRAILLDVDFKVRADGTTFANFHTLDLKVIEARGNEVWRDPQVRDLWNGDRTSMESDFYAYLSNASLPSGDPNRKPSFRLLDRGDGLGGQRRDALHQMLGFHKGSDLPYINKPIAEIPVGIRHSVTTFSNDGIVAMRTAGNERVNYSHNNAHLDLSRNFMPSEMREEKTPSGGKLIRHATGYKISKQAGEKFKVFDSEGKSLGQFDTIADAGRAAQKHFNDTFDKSVEGKDKPVPNTETPPSRQAYIEREFEKSSATYNNTFVGGKDNYINNVKVLLDRFINGREDIGVGDGYIERAKKLKASIEKNGNIKLSELEELSKLGAGIMHDTSRLPYYNYDFFWQATGDLLSEHLKKAGERYDNMYPMEIKSALYPRLAQIFQDYPNLTAQGLLKKLVVYGSQGSRMFQEATEIGLVDLLKSKIQKTTTPRFLPDGTRIDMAQGVTQPKLDMTEILDFAKSKEIKVTIEEGAREVSGMNTSKYTLGGAKDNYKETAIRINPEYAHGVRGHYGEDTIVHFRTTERLDADGNRHLYIEEVQANNTDKSSRPAAHEVTSSKKSLEVLKKLKEDGINSGVLVKGLTGGTDSAIGRLTDGNVQEWEGGLWDRTTEDGKLHWGLISKINEFASSLAVKYQGDSQRASARIHNEIMDYFQHTNLYSGHIDRGNISDNLYSNIEGSGYREGIWMELIKTQEYSDFIDSAVDLHNQYQDWAVKNKDYRNKIIIAGYSEDVFLQPSKFNEFEADLTSVIQRASGEFSKPLTSAKDWSLTALKGIIRQAIRDGLDKITLTHPDDSPTVSHMAGDARQGLYGKLIPEVWGAWLRRYGIEIKQTNKLSSPTLESAKNSMAKVTDKIHDANQKALDRLSEVQGRENSQVINNLAVLLSSPVHEFKKTIQGDGMNKGYELINQVNDVKLRDMFEEILMLKATEVGTYDTVLKIQEQSIPEQHSLGKSGSSGNEAKDARISAEAIDRGMTFELNDRIKRDFLDGKIQTHMMPSEGEQGGRTYTPEQMSGKFIGRYASENPKATKGLKPKFNIFSSGDEGNIELIKGQDSIGYINFSLSKDTGNAEIDYTTIAKNQQSKGYGNLLYSELIERLRSMGIKTVTGMIIDDKGRPLKIRRRIIDQENARVGGKPTSIDAFRIDDEGDKIRDVTSYLEQNARYMPSEDWSETIAEAQRDKPENAMVKAQYKIGGGSMPIAIEHAGDILHRTYERININNGSFGYKTVKYKVDLVLKRISDLLLNKDEFRREVVSNFANNKNSTGTSEQHFAEVKKLLKEFGNAHAELPANNELQRRVKALNVSLGNLDFYSAHRELKFLNTKLVNEKTWTSFAKEGMSESNPSTSFMPAEGEQGGRKYNKSQMDNQFIGKQAEERRNLTNGIRLAYRGWDKQDGKDEGRKLIILTRTADGAEIGRIDFDYNHLTKNGMKSRGFGDGDKDGIIVDGINVKVREAFQGKGYQHILYSEMFERARAIGATGFSQSIENKKGLPLKSVNRVIGEAENFIASLTEPDAQKPTQENFDRLMANAPTPTGDWTSNAPSVQNWGKIDPKAWYMPAEYQGGDDYYKPKKNPFEYRDGEGLLVRRPFVPNSELTGDKDARGHQVNPADYNVQWDDIGHYPQTRETKALNIWEIKNSGLWADDPSKGIISKNPAESSDNFGYTHAEWFEKYQYDEDRPPVYGRYEKPRYDDKGNLVERGKLSITSRYSDHFSNMSEVYEYKEKVAKKLKVNPEDIDAFYFGANFELKKQLGYGSKDNLPIKFQPAEGWRDWQSERTSLGSVVKNAVGYVIMVQGDKFKVYNPYKAMIGIYSDLEQAKRRVQRDEPKQ